MGCELTIGAQGKHISKRYDLHFRTKILKRNQYEESRPDKKDRLKIERIIRKHKFFNKICSSDFQWEYLVSSFNMLEVPPKIYLFRKGDQGDAFYIIKNGCVLLEQFKKQLKSYQYFGDLSLLMKRGRSASAVTTENTFVWCLSNSEIYKVKNLYHEKIYNQVRPILERVDELRGVSKRILDSLVHNFQQQQYSQGEIILKKDQNIFNFYIIQSGRVLIEDQTNQSKVYTKGSFFGQIIFNQNQAQQGLSAKVIEDSVILELDCTKIESMLTGGMQLLRRHEKCMNLMADNARLTDLDQYEKQLIFKKLAFQTFLKGQKIQLRNKIFFPLTGHFRSASVSLTSLLFLQQSTFLQAAENSEAALLKLQQIPRAQRSKKRTFMLKVHNSKHQEFSVRLQDLMVIEQVRSSSLGILLFEVLNTESGREATIYCIKFQNYNLSIIQQIQSIVDFNKALSQDFIVKPVHQGSDDKFYYLIQERQFSVCIQALMSKPLDSQKCFDLAVPLLELLQQMHDSRYVVRQFTPHNICFQESGQVFLKQTRFLKKLSKVNGFRAFSVVGTHYYKAPQVLLGKGYTFTSDLWSLGMILYQMRFGKMAFGDTEDPFQLTKRMLQRKVQFSQPTLPIDFQLIDFITQLLSHQPEKRLCFGFDYLRVSVRTQSVEWLEKRHLPLLDSLWQAKRLNLNKVQKQKSNLFQYLPSSPKREIVWK